MNCVCTVCRAHLVMAVARFCDDCDQAICPRCGSHGTVALLGAWLVPPDQAASVRASVWGRAN